MKGKIFISSIFLFSLLLCELGWKMPVRSDSISYHLPCWGKDNKIYFIKKVTYGRYYHKWAGFIGPYSVLKVECYLCSMNYDGTEKKEIAKIGEKKRGFIKDEVIKGVIVGNYRLVKDRMDYCRANDMLVFDDPEGIWTVKTDGTRLKLIKKDGGHPSWSPDGKQIVYNLIKGKSIYGSDYENAGIYVMDADGSNEKLISIKTPVKVKDNEGNMIEVMKFKDESPIWSPKGDLIAFVSNGWIWVMKPDGSERRKVIDYDRLIDWLPDGEGFSVNWTYAFGLNGEEKKIRGGGYYSLDGKLLVGTRSFIVTNVDTGTRIDPFANIKRSKPFIYKKPNHIW